MLYPGGNSILNTHGKMKKRQVKKKIADILRKWRLYIVSSYAILENIRKFYMLSFVGNKLKSISYKTTDFAFNNKKKNKKNASMILRARISKNKHSFDQHIYIHRVVNIFFAQHTLDYKNCEK